MFAPGETIAQEFTIPFADAELKEVVFTYKQNNKVILTKHITSGFEKITEVSTRITIILSQQESLLFDEKNDYTIQLNVYTTRGSRAASTELKGSNAAQHYKDVINNA